jgi:hypothetical protein
MLEWRQVTKLQDLPAECKPIRWNAAAQWDRIHYDAVR